MSGPRQQFAPEVRFTGFFLEVVDALVTELLAQPWDHVRLNELFLLSGGTSTRVVWVDVAGDTEWLAELLGRFAQAPVASQPPDNPGDENLDRCLLPPKSAAMACADRCAGVWAASRPAHSSCCDHSGSPPNTGVSADRSAGRLASRSAQGTRFRNGSTCTFVTSGNDLVLSALPPMSPCGGPSSDNREPTSPRSASGDEIASADFYGKRWYIPGVGEGTADLEQRPHCDRWRIVPLLIGLGVAIWVGTMAWGYLTLVTGLRGQVGTLTITRCDITGYRTQGNYPRQTKIPSFKCQGRFVPADAGSPLSTAWAPASADHTGMVVKVHRDTNGKAEPVASEVAYGAIDETSVASCSHSR